MGVGKARRYGSLRARGQGGRLCEQLRGDRRAGRPAGAEPARLREPGLRGAVRGGGWAARSRACPCARVKPAIPRNAATPTGPEKCRAGRERGVEPRAGRRRRPAVCREGLVAQAARPRGSRKPGALEANKGAERRPRGRTYPRAPSFGWESRSPAQCQHNPPQVPPPPSSEPLPSPALEALALPGKPPPGGPPGLFPSPGGLFPRC